MNLLQRLLESQDFYSTVEQGLPSRELVMGQTQHKRGQPQLLEHRGPPLFPALSSDSLPKGGKEGQLDAGWHEFDKELLFFY